MDRTFWISELGRLFRRSSEAIDKGDKGAVKPLTDEFNEMLSNLKEEFSQNGIVVSVDEVTPTKTVASSFLLNPRTGDREPLLPQRMYRDEALHEIRSRCERIANALGYDLPDLEDQSVADELTIISMESSQTAQQETNTEVSIEATQELINHLPQDEEIKQELRDIVDQFDEEMSKDDPDESQLRQLLEEAKDYSTSVTAKLGIIALKKGLFGVFGL